MRSSSNLSTNARVSSLIRYGCGFCTNCRPHPLHRYFCAPVWMLPFFTICVLPHFGHFSSIFLFYSSLLLFSTTCFWSDAVTTSLPIENSSAAPRRLNLDALRQRLRQPMPAPETTP